MIVFSFMQEDSREGANYLVTNIFENYQDLLNRWLDDFMSFGLVDWDGNPVDRDMMEDILCGCYNEDAFEAHNGEVIYTFSVIDTDNYDSEYFQYQRDVVARVKSRRG